MDGGAENKGAVENNDGMDNKGAMENKGWGGENLGDLWMCKASKIVVMGFQCACAGSAAPCTTSGSRDGAVGWALPGPLLSHTTV